MTSGLPGAPAPTIGLTGPVRLASAAPAGLYDIDPDTVAALVISCPAVAGLSGGPFGAAATYLPGRKVAGVQITPSAVEVHVVGRYGIPVTELARQVRRALAGLVLGRTVDIVVEDLEDPDGAPSSTLAGTAPVAPASTPTRPVPATATAGLDVGWPPPATLPPPSGLR